MKHKPNKKDLRVAGTSYTRPGAALFNLHLQVYFVAVSFMGLLYLEPVVSPPAWPFQLAVVWGFILLLQFVIIFRKKRGGIKSK